MPARCLLIVLVAILVPALGGCAVDSLDTPYAERQTSAELAFDTARSVTIEGDNGDVTVRRGEGDQARVRADIRGRGEKRVAAVQVIMQTDAAGDLSIRVDWPIGWRTAGEAAQLEVTLPGCAGLAIHTGNGAISVVGLEGKAVVDSGNGAISITDHSGDLEISTANGLVEVARIAGECRIRTSNGRVDAREIGGRLSVSTTNGTVDATLTDANPGPADIRTANGSVELAIGSAFAGHMRLETFNGRVSVRGISGDLEVDEEREWAAIQRPGPGRSLIRTSNGRIEVRSLTVQ